MKKIQTLKKKVFSLCTILVPACLRAFSHPMLYGSGDWPCRSSQSSLLWKLASACYSASEKQWQDIGGQGNERSPCFYRSGYSPSLAPVPTRQSCYGSNSTGDPSPWAPVINTTISFCSSSLGRVGASSYWLILGLPCLFVSWLASQPFHYLYYQFLVLKPLLLKYSKCFFVFLVGLWLINPLKIEINRKGKNKLEDTKS